MLLKHTVLFETAVATWIVGATGMQLLVNEAYL